MLRSLTLKTPTPKHAVSDKQLRSRRQVTTLLLLILITGAVFEIVHLRIRDVGTTQNSLKPLQTASSRAPRLDIRATYPRDTELITIPAGSVQIGDNNGPLSERPVFNYISLPFLMDRTPVTVAQFAAFVKDTGYKTDAERYGSAGVVDEKQGGWVAISGANWRLPTGPKGKPAERDHPVTQVSWYDADAFCRAYGSRLPTEFEWERAARMGQTPGGHVFKSGDSIERHGHYLINAWEGTFPLLNTDADGYHSTSPVGAFGTAPSGLTDMAGNVWEWTSSWYLPYGMPQHEPPNGDAERVARGGSFLCSATYCQGYRASARNHTTPDTSLENIGFRCVTDPARISSLAGRVVSNPSSPVNHDNQLSSSRGETQ